MVIRSSDQSKLVFVTTVFSKYYKYNGIFVVDKLKGALVFLESNIKHQSNRHRRKDWGAKKVTIYFPVFYLVKSSENILLFYLHFI